MNLLNAPSLKGVLRRGHDLRCDCGAPLNSQACCVITGWVGTDCNRASRARAAQRCYSQAAALGREIENRKARAARFVMPPAWCAE